jgi:isopentenyl phosphate kinase
LKTIIQLLIAALVVHGCVRFGSASWRNYQFKDAVEQEVRFTPQATAAELQMRVAQLAADYEIVLEPDNVTVERRGQETFVRASYSELIPLVPGFYTREQPFTLDVRVRVLAFEKIR